MNVNDRKNVLELQEIDMKMIRLMVLKQRRKKELRNVLSLKETLQKQFVSKEKEVKEINFMIKSYEQQVDDLNDKIKNCEKKQNSLKQLNEFNAISHEISSAKKEVSQIEQLIAKLVDELLDHESALNAVQEDLNAADANCKDIEKEIFSVIKGINEEGKKLQQLREKLMTKIPKDILAIYEKLLKKNGNRVVVPIEEGRVCRGCNMLLTAHYENLVRKEDKVIFCEHCSRILYYDAINTSQRRRRR